MGSLQPVYVIGEIYSENEHLTELDEYISKSPMKSLFAKCNGMANGVITYFMGWDGSKCGWDTQIEAETIRSEFIQLLHKADANNIWEVYAGHDVENPFISDKSLKHMW